MKKFKGLIIPEHEKSDDRISCCNSSDCTARDNNNFYVITCDECLFFKTTPFNHWLKLGRPCEICEDEE